MKMKLEKAEQKSSGIEWFRLEMWKLKENRRN
jgi:hypothetical protein